ncbi:MAG: glycosyltransferase family 39 protein [Anaerolineae bacterium]|nr:glycosyltransferase family 39 protein [Anaerolineae bacterium]
MKTIFCWLKSPSHFLILILAFSVVARLAGAVYMGDRVEELPGTFDQISYHLLAQRVLGGYGFTFGQTWWPMTGAGEPTAHWSFLYTLYLAAVYSIFGVHPLVARIMQAILFGILQPYLTFRIGRRLYGPAAGLIGALLAAGYAYFIYYGGTLMTEPFYITTILLAMDLCLDLVMDTKRGNKPINWGILGLVLGITVLLRQVFLLMIPFILVWVAWAIHYRGRRLSLRLLVLPILVVIAMILPFTIFNTYRFGHPVLLNTNAGYAFFWGNHPSYGTKFQSILPTETYQQMIPEALRSLDEAELDSVLMKLALQNVVDDPGRYVLLSFSRVKDFFMFWPSPDSVMISNISRVVSFGILWPFMLAGLVLSLWQLRGKFEEAMAAGSILLILFIVVYSGIHLMTWALVRYRLPVDAVALVFAAMLIAKIDARFFHLGKRWFGIPESAAPREMFVK